MASVTSSGSSTIPHDHLNCFRIDRFESYEGEVFGIGIREQCVDIDAQMGLKNVILGQLPGFKGTTGDTDYTVYTVSYAPTFADLQRSISDEEHSVAFQNWLQKSDEESQKLNIKNIFLRGEYLTIPGYGEHNPFRIPLRYYLIVSVYDHAPHVQAAIEKCKDTWMQIKAAQQNPGTLQELYTGVPPLLNPPIIQWSIGFDDRSEMGAALSQFESFTVREGFNIRAYETDSFSS